MCEFVRIRRFFKPFFGDGFVRVFDTVFITPRSICGLGCLTDACGGIREDHTDVKLRVLSDNEGHFLAVFGCEASFGLDDYTVG